MAGQLQSLVSIVVFVIKFAWVLTSFNDSADHKSHVAALSEESEVLGEWDVGQYDVLEDVEGLVDAVPAAGRLLHIRALL